MKRAYVSISEPVIFFCFTHMLINKITKHGGTQTLKEVLWEETRFSAVLVILESHR